VGFCQPSQAYSACTPAIMPGLTACWAAPTHIRTVERLGLGERPATTMLPCVQVDPPPTMHTTPALSLQCWTQHLLHTRYGGLGCRPHGVGVPSADQQGPPVQLTVDLACTCTLHVMCMCMCMPLHRLSGPLGGAELPTMWPPQQAKQCLQHAGVACRRACVSSGLVLCSSTFVLWSGLTTGTKTASHWGHTPWNTWERQPLPISTTAGLLQQHACSAAALLLELQLTAGVESTSDCAPGVRTPLTLQGTP
jgi:hypothetical protein